MLSPCAEDMPCDPSSSTAPRSGERHDPTATLLCSFPSLRESASFIWLRWNENCRSYSGVRWTYRPKRRSVHISAIESSKNGSKSMPHDDRVYLQHILDSILRIESYLHTVDEAIFHQQSMIQDAVVRQIEIIGEAVKRLSPSLPPRSTPGHPLAGHCSDAR